MSKKVFTVSELINAAKTMYQAQLKSEEITFSSVKEIYDNLRYVLGPHYWGYEYSWEAVHNG